MVQSWFLGKAALGAVGCAELQGSGSLKKKILLENICEQKLLTENIFPQIPLRSNFISCCYQVGGTNGKNISSSLTDPPIAVCKSFNRLQFQVLSSCLPCDSDKLAPIFSTKTSLGTIKFLDLRTVNKIV